jgi:hypothetical protein
MLVQNRFVRRHLFVKMYDLAVAGRPKSLLISGKVFAYSSVENQPLAISF